MILIRNKYAPGVAVDAGRSPMGGHPPATFKGIRTHYARLGNSLAGLARSLSGALSRSAPPALVLEINRRIVRFNDPVTFEFSLKPRTEFPAERVASLIDWPAEDIERMAAKIRTVEQRFAETIAASVERPQIIGALLRSLSLKLFSKDHGWREIIAELNRCDSEYDVYKKIALVKYTQYLRSRQKILRDLYFERRSAAPLESINPSATREAVHDGSRGPLDTDLFESSVNKHEEKSDAEAFNPLPRGETVRLRFDDRIEIPIRLSSHSFTLVAGTNFYLMDEHGSSFPIRQGKNLVGRHPDCDVVIQSFYCGVSRKHLIIEKVSDSVALLTDLSSHGTYVSKQGF
ncbi:MAG: FHA domain-containing protein [Gammaproteobacteria bacterium]|nr:FHA domain-containing protein [Gammaproteobacteria bacterium]MDH3412110.1 FHA domain-containing protein [Gammaproteobacteria bacterium]